MEKENKHVERMEEEIQNWRNERKKWREAGRQEIRKVKSKKGFVSFV